MQVQQSLTASQSQHMFGSQMSSASRSESARMYSPEALIQHLQSLRQHSLTASLWDVDTAANPSSSSKLGYYSQLTPGWASSSQSPGHSLPIPGHEPLQPGNNYPNRGTSGPHLQTPGPHLQTLGLHLQTQGLHLQTPGLHLQTLAYQQLQTPGSGNHRDAIPGQEGPSFRPSGVDDSRIQMIAPRSRWPGSFALNVTATPP
jgi:hypothetical protein